MLGTVLVNRIPPFIQGYSITAEHVTISGAFLDVREKMCTKSEADEDLALKEIHKFLVEYRDDIRNLRNLLKSHGY